MIALDLLDLVTAFVGYLLLYRLLDHWLSPRPARPQILFDQLPCPSAARPLAPLPASLPAPPMLLQGHAAP